MVARDVSCRVVVPELRDGLDRSTRGHDVWFVFLIYKVVSREQNDRIDRSTKMTTGAWFLFSRKVVARKLHDGLDRSTMREGVCCFYYSGILLRVNRVAGLIDRR